MRLSQVLLTAALFGTAACGAANGSSDDVTSTSQDLQREIRPNGKGHVTRDAKSHGGKTTDNGIEYHGGPVMHGSPTLYFIWYGNWSNDTATTLLPKLISDLSGSGYEHINATYNDGTGSVSGLLTYGGSTTDSYSHGTSLADADIQAIVTAHCGALGNCDPNAIYFVLTSSDVKESSGFCSQYCGWHDDMSVNGTDVKYAFVGNPEQCPSSCEEQTTSPNDNAGADGMASIIAHESEEAISDPDLNAWYDRRGNENADKCAWTFGTESTASNGSKYNFTGSSGTHWLIQQNWVNASGGFCAMSH